MAKPRRATWRNRWHRPRGRGLGAAGGVSQVGDLVGHKLATPHLPGDPNPNPLSNISGLMRYFPDQTKLSGPAFSAPLPETAEAGLWRLIPRANDVGPIRPRLEMRYHTDPRVRAEVHTMTQGEYNEQTLLANAYYVGMGAAMGKIAGPWGAAVGAAMGLVVAPLAINDFFAHNGYSVGNDLLNIHRVGVSDSTQGWFDDGGLHTH